jgi:dimethylargininase
MTRAFVRPVSARLAECALTHFDRVPIDAAVAVRQHATYVATLAAAGAEIVWLPPIDDAPDGVFVEDTAVVIGDVAILTRPGTPSRAAETLPMTEHLCGFFNLRHLDSGFVDGGDVARVDDVLYVGIGSRTDHDGVAALGRATADLGIAVVAVPTNGILHLKSTATYAGRNPAGDRIMLVNPAWVDPVAFAGARILTVDPTEPFAANCVALDGRLIVAAGAPRTRDKLMAEGFDVDAVDVSELQKAEAAVTCMSLIDTRP